MNLKYISIEVAFKETIRSRGEIFFFQSFSQLSFAQEIFSKRGKNDLWTRNLTQNCRKVFTLVLIFVSKAKNFSRFQIISYFKNSFFLFPKYKYTGMALSVLKIKFQKLF